MKSGNVQDFSSVLGMDEINLRVTTRKTDFDMLKVRVWNADNNEMLFSGHVFEPYFNALLKDRAARTKQQHETTYQS